MVALVLPHDFFHFSRFTKFSIHTIHHILYFNKRSFDTGPFFICFKTFFTINPLILFIFIATCLLFIWEGVTNVFGTDFFICTARTHFFLMKLLFAEEQAVYKLVGNSEQATITKLPVFNTSQSITIPEDWVYFPQFPREINELIYYKLFLYSLKDRNYEAAYYYATHVSTFLTRKIYRVWFENPGLDENFDPEIDLPIMYAEIRCYITFASLVFDVYSERYESNEIYPMKLEFNSRFRRRTNPVALCRIPGPCAFVDNHLAYNIKEIDEPMLYAAPPGPIVETIDIVNLVDIDSEDDTPIVETFQSPIFQNINYLEFRKGPHHADYCVVDGSSYAPGILKVKRLIHPCIFIELFDCSDDTWVNLENYTAIQRSAVWKKFETFLRFTIESNLALFFQVAPTNTFVTLE